jgi:hypothetical protein
MKKVFLIISGLVLGLAAMSQSVSEKKELNNDLIKERNKRNEVAKDLAHGNFQEAKADHKAAVAYHKDIHRDINQLHQQQVRRHPVHHRRHIHPRRKPI